MSGATTDPVALKGNQKLASEPRENVWLSASAGTGKTQVLSARVMRLLLSGADPSSILCLTFTKAGATEMADRINAKLAAWVRMDDTRLFAELEALGEDGTPEMRKTARKLFAKVLDASGQGLRIQTIHSFCQTLLAGFPQEAGLIPGFRPMEGREEAALQRSTLADLLVDADIAGDEALPAALRALSLRLGEGGAESFLVNCARAPDAMAGLGEDIPAAIRAALDVPEGDIESIITAACADDAFDMESVRRIARANAEWGTATGLKRADAAAGWIGLRPDRRAELLDELVLVVLRADGEPRKTEAGLLKADPDYPDYAARVGEAAMALKSLRARAGLADLLGQGLQAGRAYALAYAEAKRAAGLVDFDDLIRATVSLLGQSKMAEWIRFKLDQATDHILVDEAQDTNLQQWLIVSKVAEEFFAADPEDAEKVRTIFTVGDFKQAIFGFQGTDPRNFSVMEQYFRRSAEESGRTLHGLSLTQSFRSTGPILSLVDRVLGELGEGALSGMIELEPHESAVAGPGRVTLWSPVCPDDGASGDIEGDEGWLSDSTRSFATRLAKQIRAWLDEAPWINNRGKAKRLEPQDILILVRRRSELASLIVARLHAEGVPVAGVDRLRLNAPLAVRDLLAAVRFAVQPHDDLNLAGLLVSPLIGWSQDDLYAVAGKKRGGPLWDALGEHRPQALSDLLARADFTTPYRFLEEILSGALDGRRKLLRRLGHEARDPIEELLNAAIGFERETTATLQAFLDRFERETEDIKRDPSQPLDAVRVMTAHGAKGLQAPLVILADATVDPASSPRGKLNWPVSDGVHVPVFRPRKDELTGTLAEAAAQADAREMEEHWRLLYVALTRAEEWLVVGGALGPKAKGVAPEKSWHAAVERAMVALEVEATEEAPWGLVRHYADGAAVAGKDKVREAAVQAALPEWLTRPAPVEARPPRPLAPSSLGDDDAASPPPTPGMRAAAERGRLLHALFERLPATADPRGAALRWLEQSAGVSDAREREAIVADALAVIEAHPGLFTRDALAEAPIAAVVNGDVISGTVDRLIVEEGRVRLVDFKTGRRVPASAEDAPVHHLRQMSAYAEALKVIFPARAVEAALLYTSGPVLLRLPDSLLARHKPGLQDAEQSLGPGR